MPFKKHSGSLPAKCFFLYVRPETSGPYCVQAVFMGRKKNGHGSSMMTYPAGKVDTTTITTTTTGGAWWYSWLRHYATNRQVAGSIPDGVIGIFQ